MLSLTYNCPRAFDQAVGGLATDFGVGLVVCHDDLGRAAAELAAVQFHSELEAVTDIHAQTGAGAGQGG